MNTSHCPTKFLTLAIATVFGISLAAHAQVEREFSGSVDSQIGVMPHAHTILQPLPEGIAGWGNGDLKTGCKGCNKEAMYKAFIASRGQQDKAVQMLADTPSDTDILDNNFDVTIDPAVSFISGSNTMTLASTVNGLTQFTFRLRSNNTSITNGYTISSVVINGVTTVPGSAVTSVGTYGRSVTLDRAYNIGEQFTVKVNYSGTPVSVGFGSFVIGATAMNSLPFSCNLSEPYYSASVWPVKDGENAQPGDNSDKSTATISITAPSAYKSISNGVLQSITPVAGGKNKTTWRTNIPTASYLFCFAIHAYNVYDYTYNYPLPGGGTGSMPFQINISPPSDTANNRAVWSQSLQMMETLRPLFGVYPFVSEKYGIYQFTFGGGMENQTITGMGGFSESVTVHELGHQWWGDNVTCKTWNDIWLNEGFATYSEALWYERKPGSTGLPALHSAMASRRPAAAALTGTTSASVYCYNVTNASTVFSSSTTYNKGAWALHTLRKYVGDVKFFQILANYRTAYQGSGATTQQFADVASATYGSSLQDYFDSFVFGQGAPVYSYGTQAVTINGKTYLKLHLKQTQSTLMGKAGKFVTPIDVKMTTASGATTAVIFNNEREESFVIPTNGLVTAVVLDESNWILNNGKASSTYLASPPKLLEAFPAPGATLDCSASPTTAQLTFSENIVATGANFTVVGPSGAITTTYSYNAGTNTVSLGLGTLSVAGTYTVTVSDLVTAGGIRLDGEIANASSSASLPSGDGLANGAAVYTFTLACTPCPADLNADGLVDSSDASLALLDFGFCPNCAADLDGDSNVDSSDISLLLLDLGSCP